RTDGATFLFGKEQEKKKGSGVFVLEKTPDPSYLHFFSEWQTAMTCDNAGTVDLHPHALSMALVHPQIAPNTGNIGRLCVASGCDLHLVRPLGFVLSD